MATGVVIESNAAEASTHATSLTANYGQITSVGDAAKDTVSRFSGNTQAHSAIDNEKSVATAAGAKSVDFVQVLQGMASEFQTTDASISNAIAAASAQTKGTADGGTDLGLFSEGGANL